MSNFQESAKKFNISTAIITSIVTALTIVSGLFWNDAVKAGIENILPPRDEVSAKFIAAFMVTVIVTFAILIMYRIQQINLDNIIKKQISLHKKKLNIRRKRLHKAILESK